MTERNKTINNILNDVGDRLFDYIRYRVPTTEDAEDILQDVLLQFTASFDSIISFERVLGWLYSVSRNKITDLFRKRKKNTDDVTYDESSELQSIINDLTIDPEDEYERLFLEQELESAINQLPGKQKEIFIQNELEDKSFRKIAAETNESINTLLARKRYAVQSLRKQLSKSFQEILEVNK